jgi:hypothetical protein
LIVEPLACLIIESLADYVERTRQARCQANKQKMNKTRWKEPTLIDKRTNNRLGLKPNMFHTEAIKNQTTNLSAYHLQQHGSRTASPSDTLLIQIGCYGLPQTFIEVALTIMYL